MENPVNTELEQKNLKKSSNIGLEQREIKEVSVEMFDFWFLPSVLGAHPRETIYIKLSERGKHDFVIDELRVLSRVLEEGGETTVEITIPEDAVGKGYAFYCNIGSHRARGIEGGVKDFAKNLSLSNNTG